MFWFTHEVGPVTLAFSDARVDLTDLAASERSALTLALGADQLAFMTQVHGSAVASADSADVPVADALVLDRPGLAAVVRVADCTPVVLVAPGESLAAVVHAGRVGMLDGVVPAAVAALRSRGATDLEAWVGPRACAGCYEVPADMADAAAEREPGTRSTTRRGTPAIDVGAGVVAQLTRDGVVVHDIGADVCTIEDSRFPSFRRDGAAAGRFGAFVALTEESA